MRWPKRLAPCLLCVLNAALTLGGAKVYDILDYGANPDGKTLCTAAIQKAIDEAAGDGGGTVRIPAGTFLSGALRMRREVTLQIDEDATLLGSRNLEDYYGPPADAEGRPIEGDPVFHNLIHGVGLTNISIRGKGTIDGNGDAFRDKTKPRAKCIYLENCRNIVIQDVRLRAAGSWMQHYRACEDLTIRNIDVFNHVAFNNDGLNIDSCRNVTITGCRVDSDDDGIVLKSLSTDPCQNVTVSDCVISSHCNGLKMGTESGGGFVDITIRNCTVFSPKKSKATYGRDRGLAGVALEIVDGGRMDNISISDVAIEGVSVPIFLRLGNRGRLYGRAEKPAVGTLQNVQLKNIAARGTSPIGCAISGLPGHCIENVKMENISLGFEGGGTVEDTRREIPEREDSYPESTMFGTLPAWGFYCRHVKGLEFSNVQLNTDAPDLRHAMMFSDAQDIEINGLSAQFSPGAASMIRMSQTRNAVIRRCSPASATDTLLQLEGGATEGIRLEECDLSRVATVADISPQVPEGALSRE